MKPINIARTFRYLATFAPLVTAILVGAGNAHASEPTANACPVDGCDVRILEVQAAGSELALTFKSNFLPDVSKNHLHVWWGENYNIKQVGIEAEKYGVEIGKWHRHDDYPTYTTTGGASTTIREGAVTVCVTAADRNHKVLDITLYHCVDASDQL